MKINQLQYFVKVVQTNNITKASKLINVSQPAISKAIHELEEEFGTSLFIRYNNQLVLTDEGHQLYLLALPLLKDIEKLQDSMMAFVKKSKALKIGVPPMLGSFVISSIIADYAKDHPEIEIQIVEHGSVASRKALLNRDSTLALTILEPDQSIEEGLCCEELFESELLFAISKDSALAKKERLEFEDIASFPLILMKEDCLQSSLITNEFAARGLTPNIKIRTNQIYTIRELLINNHLGAFIFHQILEHDEKLVGISIGEGIKLRIVLAYRKDQQLDPISADFIRFAKEKIVKLGENQ